MAGKLGRTKSFFLLLGCVFACLMTSGSNARATDGVEVKNVRFEVAGRMIAVSYDLQGPAGRNYLVKMTLMRKQNAGYSYTPVALKGDVGEGSFSGSNKKVTWDFFKEFPQGLDGDDFYFQVRAEILPERSNMWLYIAGGAVVAGGAAAAILLSGGSSDKTTTTDQTYPKPIGRPGSY